MAFFFILQKYYDKFGELREATKKSSYLSGHAAPGHQEGGGLNGCATKEKRTFFCGFPNKVPTHKAALLCTKTFLVSRLTHGP